MSLRLNNKLIKAKKNCAKKEREQTDSESIKENIPKHLNASEKKSLLSSQNHQDYRENYHNVITLDFSKEEVNLKPKSFWSKKLQDLESQENSIKNKKCRLYEFNASEDSFSPTKQKKRCQRNNNITKKKQAMKSLKNYKNMTKAAFKGKSVGLHERPMPKNRLLLDTEKLEKRGNFTIMKKETVFGLTSTPVPNRANLISESNFMFLSPVTKEKEFKKYKKKKDEHYPASSTITPTKINKKSMVGKKQNNEVNNDNLNTYRVLRSGKIVSTK